MRLDEARVSQALRSWLERTVVPLLREGSLEPDQVADEMMRELSALSRVDPDQNVIAPDQFTLTVHPQSALVLRGHMSDVHASLSRSFEHQLRDLGFSLRRRVHVTLATDPTMAGGDVKVIAWHSADPLKVTRELTQESEAPPGSALRGAFLMVEGRRHYQLIKDEITIGRLLENDIVLDDPHVSRRHSQVVREGNFFVVHDQGSTAGTLVNGTRTSGHQLRPGDVISIAGIDIVYGESHGGPPGDVQSYTPPPMPPHDAHKVTPLDLRTVEIPTRSFSPPDEPEDEDQGSQQGA